MNPTTIDRSAAFEAARTAYHQAAARLADELLAKVARAVREAYPDAATLHAAGEINEEGQPVLRAQRVTDIAGRPLDGWDEEGNYYTEGGYPSEWDDLTDEVDPDLDWLVSLTGDDYMGRQEFDLAAWAQSDPPADLLHLDRAP